MLRENANQAVLAIVLIVFASCSGQPKRSQLQESNSVNLINSGKETSDEESIKTGIKVSKWYASMPVNPEELGGYIEGDIIPYQGFRRNGITAENTRWPGGVVPYMLSPYFNEKHQRVIREAMADFHQHTCVKFKPYKGEESDYIRITAGETGCWSPIGRTGGPQNINLQVPGCLIRKGTIIHELMHTIGFYHEQSRFERDNYVTIKWNNIEEGLQENFLKQNENTTNAFGVLYDYGSVMHYSTSAFSKNGLPTIIPKDRRITNLGQREGLSAKDIQKIQRMYKCNERKRRITF